MNAGNDEACRKSYAKFNEVWRPVLNYDPYKLEAVKQRIREVAKMGVPEGETVNEIRWLAETLRDYAPPYDWGRNIFAGIVYSALGDKDETINCVEYGNVASGRETEISGVILAQMKRGKIDASKLAGASTLDKFPPLTSREEDSSSTSATFSGSWEVHRDSLLATAH